MNCLYSSSSTTFRCHPGSTAFSPVFCRTDPLSFDFCPFESYPPGSRVVKIMVVCNHEGLKVSSGKLPTFSCFGAGPPIDPTPKFDFSQQVTDRVYVQPKEIGKETSCMALFFSLVLFTVQSFFAPLAFATMKPAGMMKEGLSSVTAWRKPSMPTEMLTSCWTGFFTGCLHTLSGPDHLAALAPLSIGRPPVESLLVGALWGCGHEAGQIMFGLLFLLLKDRFHFEVIRTWGTRVVGFTLIIIGALGIRGASSESPTHCTLIENGEGDAIESEKLESTVIRMKKNEIGFATFATGIIHGLQPDALMMVLAALALPSRLAGGVFLAMFLIGTVVAMGSYAAFIGSCSQALKDHVPRIAEKLTWVSSFVALSLGLAIIVSQFCGYNLF